MNFFFLPKVSDIMQMKRTTHLKKTTQPNSKWLGCNCGYFHVKIISRHKNILNMKEFLPKNHTVICQNWTRNLHALVPCSGRLKYKHTIFNRVSCMFTKITECTLYLYYNSVSIATTALYQTANDYPTYKLIDTIKM